MVGVVIFFFYGDGGLGVVGGMVVWGGVRRVYGGGIGGRWGGDGVR